jgi:Zn-dependent protease with chaperone function
LGLNYEPLTIYYAVWMKFGGIRAAPSDVCLLGVKGSRRGYLYLPAILRGRLSADEWKPLIASSLITFLYPSLRSKRLRMGRLWILTLALITPATAAIVLLYVNNPFVFFLTMPALVLLLSVVARKVNMAVRKYLLLSDTMAANITGREQMIHTLKKIDSMGFADIEEREKEKQTIWRKEGVLPWPSITQRIKELEQLD